MPKSTMQVEVELQYEAIPPDDELDTIRRAGRTLTCSPKSVTVTVQATDASTIVILKFDMKTQAQYKVVQEISDEVTCFLSELFLDICIRFHQP
jgi:hypothetical protein